MPAGYDRRRSSSARLRHEAHAGQVLEMPIAGQHVGAMRERGRVDDSIRRRQLVVGGRAPPPTRRLPYPGSATIQVAVNAITSVRPFFVEPRVSSHFASSELHHGRHQPFLTLGQFRLQASCRAPTPSATRPRPTCRQGASDPIGPVADSPSGLRRRARDAGEVLTLRHRHQQHALTLGDEGENLPRPPVPGSPDGLRDRDLELRRESRSVLGVAITLVPIDRMMRKKIAMDAVQIVTPSCLPDEAQPLVRLKTPAATAFRA